MQAFVLLLGVVAGLGAVASAMLGAEGSAAGFSAVVAVVLARGAVQLWQCRDDSGRLKLLESVVVSARDAVIVLDGEPDGHRGRAVRYVNPEFERMTGFTASEVVGRSLHILRGPATSEATLADLRAALEAGRPLQTELLNYRKDQSELWVELSLVPVGPTGYPSHWVMIQRDINDRKRADAELRAREHQLRVLGDNLPGGAVYQLERSAAGQHTFRYISAGVEPLVGVSPVELVAEAGEFFARVHPDDAARLLAADAAAATHLTPFDCLFRVRHATGEWRTLHCRSMPERLPGGGTRCNGVMMDTTDRSRLEDQLRQAQKMETVGRLAGGVAHDFNNLLTSVIGNLAHTRFPADDPNAAYVATAVRAAGRAADLTQKLLGFARKNQLRVGPVALPEFLEEVVGLVRRTGDPRVVIAVEVPATLPPALADPALLNQALLNLLLNARDALPGGGRITVSADAVTLTSTDCMNRSEARAGEFVRVRVADTGIGMDAGTQARLFEPFFTTKPLGQGTGLGLAMVHGITQQHAGWIECESVPGSGTRFDMYLPRAEVNAPTPPPTPFRARAPLGATPVPALTSSELDIGRGRTIILADDEEMIRSLGKSVLENVGFRVVEAADGLEAVAAFRRESPHVALTLLDLMMPEADGRQAFDAITRLDPTARVLFSSGYSADDLSDLLTQAWLLPKPYRPSELVTAVRAVVDHQPHENRNPTALAIQIGSP